MKQVIPIFILAIIISGCKKEEEIPTRTTPPNIILMLADDLGYNDLSFYRERYGKGVAESPTSQTPYLDRLAEEGVHFTNFYAGAAVCSPSRAALLTGRNKTRLGIYNWIPGNSPMHLQAEEITIAEMLSASNYQTGHFGKWHLTSRDMPQPEPMDQGFDYAFWTHNNAKPSHENPTNFIKNREKVGEITGYSSHLVVEETMNWLEKQKESDQPFYINVWFHEPHHKEAAPDSLKNRHTKHKAYYGCIENMDYAVGKLLNYLDKNGLRDNTLILFTSDNGSEKVGSNAHFRGEKCYQYEGGVRVPFIASWQGKINQSGASNWVGHFTDVSPTLAQITEANLPQNKYIDGENFSELLLSPTKEIQREEPLFFYRYFHDPICMLRKGDKVLLGYQNKPTPWQINYDATGDALIKPKEGQVRWAQWGFQEGHMDTIRNQQIQYFELYDVSKDPSQKNDIAADEPETVEHLKKIMLSKKKEMVAEGGNWFPKAEALN